jgi:hypothetical protein
MLAAATSAPAPSFYNGITTYSCMFDTTATTKTEYSPAVAADSTRIGTLSLWFKKTRVNKSTAATLFYAGDSGGTGNLLHVHFKASEDFLSVHFDGTPTNQLYTTNTLEDCAGWYHLVVGIDTTQATAANRAKIYLNGSQVSSFTTESYMAQNTDMEWTTSDLFNVGGSSSLGYFDGYIADVHWIDGTQYAATHFGEWNQGAWIPKTFSGSYGTKGFNLDFADNTSFGNDVSGNNNDLTDTNLGTDHQVSDTPESNYCTIDYNAMHASATLTEGGLKLTYSSTSMYCGLGTFPMKSGKWYWEVDTLTDCTQVSVGITDGPENSGDHKTASSWSGYYNNSWGILVPGSGTEYDLYDEGTKTDTAITFSAGDVIMVAFDADSSKLWIGVNDSWYNSGDPDAGTNATYDSTDNIDPTLYDYVPIVGSKTNGICYCNFGQRGFTYTPPSSFKKLCVSNLPDPDIIDSEAGFEVVTYVGDDGSQSITSLDFSPDLVWIKNADTSVDHKMVDTTRGATYRLSSNQNYTSASAATGLTAFLSNGFTVGTTPGYNDGSDTHAAFCWKEGATYGFEMVTYAGTGAAQNISHNLDAAPELILVKCTDGAYDWAVYHHHALNKTDPETDRAALNLNYAWTDNINYWNDTAPTSSQFTVRSDNTVNASGKNYIAYLWHGVEGFSKVFSYIGNANASGPYVYTGFLPRWVLWKNFAGSNAWLLWDTAREPENPLSEYLLADYPNAAANVTAFSVFSNGFRIDANNTGFNANNGRLGGIAFAEQPFKYANAH